MTGYWIRSAAALLLMSGAAVAQNLTPGAGGTTQTTISTTVPVVPAPIVPAPIVIVPGVAGPVVSAPVTQTLLPGATSTTQTTTTTTAPVVLAPVVPAPVFALPEVAGTVVGAPGSGAYSTSRFERTVESNGVVVEQTQTYKTGVSGTGTTTVRRTVAPDGSQQTSWREEWTGTPPGASWSTIRTTTTRSR